MKQTTCVLLVALWSFFLPAQTFDAEQVLKKEWKAFLGGHPSLADRSPGEIAELANQRGKSLASTLAVTEAIREIDADAVEKSLALLSEEEPKVFMRHGEQEQTARVKQLAPELQKIEMMRLADNSKNSLTKASTAEWIESMIVWEYFRQKTGRRFVVESSENKRAAVPANALALALKKKVKYKKSLNCVNYPSRKIRPDADILKLLPDGTLPWEKQKIDAVIGAGTYERITKDMKALLKPRNGDNTAFVAITHTQQTNAVATLNGLPAVRLGNFGFMIVTGQHREVLPSGFYKKK